MEALVFSAKTKLLRYERNKRVPSIADPNSVLIKVSYAGICGTDLHIIQGEFPCNPDVPFTPGHELSGIVTEIGDSVTNLTKGDRVSVDPNNGCERCDFCRSGNPHYCKVGGINNTIGIYRDGGWAQYILVPETQVHKLPDTITLEQAALTEPLSCLAHGWDRISPVHVGQKILVTGAGIIGNLWVTTLHLQGHRHVTVSEPNPNRLALLEKLETGYDLVTPDVLAERHRENAACLFDLIIDCSGYAPAIEQAFQLLNAGGKLCIFGVAPPTSTIKIAPFDVYMKEATIIGVNINPFTIPKAIGLLESLGDRYLNYDKLGIKTFKLKEYEEALEMLRKGSIAKAIFKFE